MAGGTGYERGAGYRVCVSGGLVILMLPQLFIDPKPTRGYASSQGCNCNMNGCPRGFAGDPVKECTCTNAMISRYQKRLSGPLLDRIDIHVEVPRVEYEKLSDNRLGEPSSAIRARVEAARKRQRERFKAVQGVSCNAEMRPAEVREFCELDAAGQALIKAAMRQLHLSARAYHRILKLARTIADLAESERIEAAHLAEALQYRPKEQG